MNLRATLIVVLFSSIYASEPECSRFHYEEKTLEKMINTEIFVQNMKSEIDKRDQKMEEVLDKITEDWKVTKSELLAVKDRHEDSITEYRIEVDKIKDDAIVPVVAFQADKLQNLSPKSGETLIFTDTDFDKGPGYNNKTGVYTTPLRGVYLFTCQLCIQLKKNVYVELVSGETAIVRMYMDTSATGACRRMTGISVMEANEQVKIKAFRSSGGTTLWQDTTSWSIFSGVLINTFN